MDTHNISDRISKIATVMNLHVRRFIVNSVFFFFVNLLFAQLLHFICMQMCVVTNGKCFDVVKFVWSVVFVVFYFGIFFFGDSFVAPIYWSRKTDVNNYNWASASMMTALAIESNQNKFQIQWNNKNNLLSVEWNQLTMRSDGIHHSTGSNEWPFNVLQSEQCAVTNIILLWTWVGVCACGSKHLIKSTEFGLMKWHAFWRAAFHHIYICHTICNAFFFYSIAYRIVGSVASTIVCDKQMVERKTTFYKISFRFRKRENTKFHIPSPISRAKKCAPQSWLQSRMRVKLKWVFMFFL